MKTYLRMICLTLCVAFPMVSQAGAPFSNGSTPRGRIIKTLPGKSNIKGEMPRGITPEERIQNDRASFCVRVSVCLLDDHGKHLQARPNRMFAEGECMGIQVVSAKPGYLYLFYKQADGSEKCLFPNKFDQNNQIAAKRTIMVPGRSYGFNLRISPPLGQEALIALVTEKPLGDAAFDHKSLTESAFTEIDLDGMIAKGVDVELRDKPDRWAEHGISITTHAKGVSGVDTSPRKKRVGLFIGLSDYLDERIPDLSICHTDARAMADAMREYCNLDAAGVLVNSQATRAAVEKAFKELKEITNPGDEIFIYWSGHGASCANTGDEDNEPDGLDEFLVPYDASPENLEATVLMDDTLGRWIQAFDGRNVVIILDACHSGGQSTEKGIGNAGSGAKNLASENGSRAKTVRWGYLPAPGDLLQGELARIKDIGQDDAVMLASSASAEISAERRDQKMSVMTYFLVEQISTADSLTLKQAYKYVSREVPKYMKEHYPGRTQTPVLCPEGADVKLK